MLKPKQSGAEGHKTSPPTHPEPKPWTAEEMEAARPLPIPETEPQAATPSAPGVPHFGAGHVKPGGRPESK